MKNSFGGVFDGVTVLVTGHTGFKGSWLSIWLNELGARVIGYSLEPPTEPSNYAVSRVADHLTDVRADVRDGSRLREVVETHRPKVVFHLAAQSLVLEGYQDPLATFHINSGGTVNLLEAIRTTDCVQAAVCVTTDKCYENQNFIWGYRETDRLGGHDPYSASKAMAELAVAAYRSSYAGEAGVLPPVASVRAGNVIGGGDWSADRLVPDCMRALMAGQDMVLRNPLHVRPWQHVVEPLAGYLWLAARLLSEGERFAEAWNFGPAILEMVTTQELVQEAIRLWGAGSFTAGGARVEKETTLLNLSWEKAARRLDWRPVYAWQEALSATVDWFRAFHEAQARGVDSVNMYDVCVEHLREYSRRARSAGVAWASE
ncbi:MAG: CDP-glucose 4,6-dehydratase [Candidatus Palauibacterales bacterium]|jgi:CDP-glucose 4,6-dehydratase|nr:CDP-glucose 4,6-dehydratase [Candidatus Palauibacterales bacterium]MDP2481971.1 CDP-glucose 4,6-dehydratase [Candidatus Palauibacterales bacterium]